MAEYLTPQEREKLMKAISTIFLKLKQRERILAFVTISTIAALLAHFFLLSLATETYQTHSKTAQIEDEINRIRSTLQELRSANDKSLKKDPLWRVRRENKGVAGLIKTVSGMEEIRNDFSVRKIASEKTEKSADFEKTTLNLEIEAPFNSLGAFLEDLEKSDLLTRVEAVQVIRTDKELKLCRARITLNSYYWRDL